MKILLLGADGQVGWQLRRSLSLLGEVVALTRRSSPHRADLLDSTGLGATVRSIRPHILVNAAAYTAVDRAEDDAETAWKVNAEACEVLAAVSAEIGAWTVHYSTDYVYDGTGNAARTESSPTGPLGVYGKSKLAGDLAIAAGNPRHLILRTSWVFDTWGGNFGKSILRAAATRDELSVVADQWGAPTRAALIADVTACALRQLMREPGTERAGVYHLAAGGVTNWHAYAQLVLAHARECGARLRVQPQQIRAIPSADYPAKAPRPANSRLDTTRLRQAFGVELPPWEEGVRAVVSEIVSHASLAPTHAN